MRPPAMMIADHPALDFLNTRAAPRDEEYEWLVDGKDLCDWLKRADIGSASDISALQAAHSTEVMNEIAGRARQLREALRAHVESGQPGLDDLVNAILGEAQTGLQLKQLGNGDYAFRQTVTVSRPADLLVLITVEIANLLAHTQPDRVRKCNGPTCTMWFHDVSKNNTR